MSESPESNEQDSDTVWRAINNNAAASSPPQEPPSEPSFDDQPPEPSSDTKLDATSQDITPEVHAEESSQTGNKLAIYWHVACVEHNVPKHPEQRGRVAAILETLRKNYRPEYFREAPLATDDQILLFHTTEHLEKFKQLADAAETARREKDKIDSTVIVHHTDLYQSVDGDTTIMWRTREAAYRAAGSIIAAIDSIYLPTDHPEHIQSAFCAVRPPGHHAERNKMLGFCFLSNAAIGAKYAQSKYGVKKVAVIDFDVHHGNGTEEGFNDDETLFYGSTHEKDNFPGTGDDPSPYVGDRAKKPIDRRIVNRTIDRGSRSARVFRHVWAEVINEMILFAPDLVIISAGFDAHDEDPLASLELQDEDFYWATKLVMKSCRKINPEKPVPVVSILEGGYDLKALASSTLVHVNALHEGYPELPVRKAGDEVAALTEHMEKIGLI